jgi:hypothetical protein
VLDSGFCSPVVSALLAAPVFVVWGLWRVLFFLPRRAFRARRAS